MTWGKVGAPSGSWGDASVTAQAWQTPSRSTRTWEDAQGARSMAWTSSDFTSNVVNRIGMPVHVFPVDGPKDVDFVLKVQSEFPFVIADGTNAVITSGLSLGNP